MLEIKPVTLTGHTVRLEPLSVDHLPDLTRVGFEESIWHYMRYDPMVSEAGLRDWVLDLLHLQEKGTDLPFAVIHLGETRAIGCTRYMNIQPAHRSLEIGGTWYGLDYQGTAVNPECKYLLLGHAFENLGCIRVQFKTDARNLRSQRAIEALGAVKEGTLRNHMITADGYVRDSVFYSILDREWPEVKVKLEDRLGYSHA
jgi:RimJ/RimL family protein N-acetyltransferase